MSEWLPEAVCKLKRDVAHIENGTEKHLQCRFGRSVLNRRGLPAGERVSPAAYCRQSGAAKEPLKSEKLAIPINQIYSLIWSIITD